jgi:hypothetical protein
MVEITCEETIDVSVLREKIPFCTFADFLGKYECFLSAEEFRSFSELVVQADQSSCKEVVESFWSIPKNKNFEYFKTVFQFVFYVMELIYPSSVITKFLKVAFDSIGKSFCHFLSKMLCMKVFCIRIARLALKRS